MSSGQKDKETADSARPQVPIQNLSAENPEEMQVTPRTQVPTLDQSAEAGDFELENEDTGTATLADKLKKLRAELEKCKEEKQEYLVGWQRCKADSINARKEAVSMAERVGNRSRDFLIEDIIPALDSFDMAIASETWTAMDANWRTGMENVRSQLITALSNQEVSSYAETGDSFDPTLHEAVQEVDAPGSPGTISRVLRRGYRAGDKIIRPAQVAIIAHPHENTSKSVDIG